MFCSVYISIKYTTVPSVTFFLWVCVRHLSTLRGGDLESLWPRSDKMVTIAGARSLLQALLTLALTLTSVHCLQ